MEIKKYTKYDEDAVMRLIEAEGEEWTYTAADVAPVYRRALGNSVTCVAYVGDVLCGYARAVDDNGLFIYVCDLLVSPHYRGNNIGRALMEHIRADYPAHTTYVMSDVDEYYQKQGFPHEGSVFKIVPQTEEV